MAAILKLRRGSTTPTSLEQSELFYNSTLGTIQVGKSSASNDNITLVKLTETNSGNLQIVGTISGSALTLSGDITASNAYFKGDVRLDGQIILGDVPQDNINVNAQFSGSLIPSASTFDLGSITKKWNNVYANNLNGSITDANILAFTQSINSFTSSQETKNSTLGTYTASLETKNSTLATYTGSINADLVSIHTYTASINDKFSTLGTYTSSVDNQLTELYSTSSNHENRLDVIETTFSTSVDERLDSLTNVTGSYATTGSNVFVNTQYISGALEIYSSSNAEIRLRNGNLNLDYHIQNTAGGNFSIHNNVLGTSVFRIDSGSTIETSHGHFFGNLFISKSVIAELAVSAPLVTATNIIVNSGSISGSITGIGNVSLYSASIDSRILSLNQYTSSNDLDIIELFTTASNHETRIDGIQDYTSSLRTAIGLNGSNVTINGDLIVQGTTTQINSTQVNIGENILELNYGGSATTAGIITKDATGGSTISGSLLWDSTNDYWKGGKLGNESKLLLAGGDGIVSGSDQIVDALKFTFLEINGDDVVSGSSQINLTQTTNYTSGIKSRLDAEGVFSGSSQVNADSITNFDTNVKDKLNIEGVFSGSSQVNADSITNFDTNVKDKLNVDGVISGSSQVTQSLDLRYLEINGDSVVSGSSQVTESLDGRYELRGTNIVSGSPQLTSSYDTRYELQGTNIVSGSSQLTSSYDLRYANSQSFHNLVGEWNYGTQGSIRDAAFYNVTSSADIVLVSGSVNYNNNHLLTAGATKKYIDWRTDEILTAIAVADITSVTAGNGLGGGGVTGDVTLSLDTSSAHFTTGIKTKLNTDGVVSGSSQIVDILLPLNSFTSSINTTIKTKLDVEQVVSGSSQITIGNVTGFNVFSASVDYRLDALESDTGSQDVRLDALEAFTSSQETKNTTLGTYTGSVDNTLTNLNSFSSSINTTIKTKLNVEGVLSGSSQIVSILGPLNTFSASQESKDSTLATYTGSIDTKFTTLATTTGSLLSSQTNLNAYTSSLNTAFQVTGSKINFQGDIVVYGTQSIINSQNVEISDNILYLSPTSSIDNDLGIVGHYNDGTYRHAGIFMDASDGHAWKVFNSLTDETIGTVNTSGTGFALADFKAANITATSFNGTINSTNGVISGSSQISGIGITNNTITIAGTSTALGGSITLATITNGSGIVSGSSQITFSSTTGFSNYLNQAVKTDSNPKFNSIGIGMDASGTAGRIDATNDIVAYSSSDRRFKENITPIENALDKINQIGGYEFDWKEENKIEHGYEGHDLGVIAQEIEAIAPELVQTRENGYKAVKYDKLVSVLIQAVKELSAKVSELENK